MTDSLEMVLRQRTMHPQVDDRSVIMLLFPYAIEKQTNNKEVVMATTGIVVCSPYGMTCTECNELVIAPMSSAHVSNREVRHFWSCDNCGHEIEMAVNLRFDGTSKPSESVGSVSA
jgi:transcription elongation factor Elf1